MRQNPQKTRFKRRKVKTLSLYCITLAVICQALAAFCGVNAYASEVQETQTAKNAQNSQNIAQIARQNSTQIADLSFGPITEAKPASGVNNFYFQDFTADYYLSKAADGTSHLRVVERFTAIFPDADQNHGITRIIPFTNQDGKNLTTPSTEELSVKLKHNGMVEEPYQLSASDNAFMLYIGSPSAYVHGLQLYELEYEFINVITAPKDNPGHQELYWDTNGTDWKQPFNSLTARVHFVGEDIKNAFDGEISCYVGAYGEKGSERCTISKISDGVEFRTSDLAARENLTFDLEFNADTFVMAPPRYSYAGLTVVIVEAIILFIIIWISCIIRYQARAKLDYYHGLFITPQYTPPADFTVAEMAENYIGQKILGSSKVATLMELAVTHKIELSKVGTEKHPQWTVKVLSVDMKPEQADVIKLLAGRDMPLEVGQEILVLPHSPDSALVRLDRKISQNVTKNLRTAGLYEEKLPSCSAKTNSEEKNSSKLCTGLMIFGILWIIVCIASWPLLAFIFISDLRPSYILMYGDGWLAAGIIILAIIIAVTAFAIYNYFNKFYSHTMEGLKWSRYLDGLRLYIKMAEQDRINFLQSVAGADVSPEGVVKLYEKLLPYAVVFRLEKSWLAEMEKYYALAEVSDPSWYSGSTFSLRDFSGAMRSFGTATIATDYSSGGSSSSGGGSSSSSGSSGGGSSGGGGGGGGGGGW